MADLKFLQKLQQEQSSKQESMQENVQAADQDNSQIDGVVKEAWQKNITDWYDTDVMISKIRELAVEELVKSNQSLRQIIDNAKKQYENVYLYFFSDNEYYIYRQLNRFEYKELSQKSQDYEQLMENVMTAAVIYPKLSIDMLDSLKAGVVPTLTELILAASNFGASNPVIPL